MAIESKWWFNNIATNSNGFMLFGLVVVRDKNIKWLVNHEKIHVKQYIELTAISAIVFVALSYFISYWFLLAAPSFFYAWYFMEWLFKGYDNIVFEKEAKQNQTKYDYLKKRKLFSFLKYF